MSGSVDVGDVERLRLALGGIARQLDRQANSEGLTRTQRSILSTVAIRGPLGLSELAEIEGVNPTMLSRVVAKLEESGLIRREVDPEDRRAARVAVTTAGLELRARLNAERTHVLDERLSEISPKSAAGLVAALPALEELVEQMKQSTRTRLPAGRR